MKSEFENQNQLIIRVVDLLKIRIKVGLAFTSILQSNLLLTLLILSGEYLYMNKKCQSPRKNLNSGLLCRFSLLNLSVFPNQFVLGLLCSLEFAF